MSDVLLLTHRIPWPPDKGDKIRSYHFFCHLADKYRLHLGTFVDSADDWKHIAELESRCASVCVRPTGRLRSVTRGLKALSQGKAVTMVYYDDVEMSRWIANLTQQWSLKAAVVYSSGMASYFDSISPAATKVLDMVDVDSVKWREYAALKSWPWSWIYKREANLLSRDEIEMVPLFDRTLLISDDEAQLLRQRSPGLARRICVVPNGVDSDYFSPGAYDNPYAGTGPVIVFTGAMDYWANVEGVCWFARSVFPRVIEQEPDARFYVVGSNPSSEVHALSQRPGIVVTGRVPDVRPYLAHANVVVAPLRIARGLQNKVLEAMAMARPVVATTAALRGIDCRNTGTRVADTADQNVDAVLQLLYATAVPANRQFVTDHFSWPAALAKLEQAITSNELAAEAGCV